MVELNLNSLTVDESGRASFSGLGSGIDFVSAVDNVIAAHRLPVDRMEADIETNALRIAAYQDLKILLGTFQSSLDTLRGAISFDNTKDVFAAKQAFASVGRTDGTAPSLAANLIGVTVSNSAAADSHEVEILQVARSQKISSDSVTDSSVALGFGDGDEFEIEGTTITVSAQDSMLALRDRINAANAGANPTGVTASIVTVSATEHYLVLNKDTAGSPIALSDTTNSPLQTVGILDGIGNLKNELQTPQMAQIHADGLLDKTNTTYESARQSSAATTLGSSGTLRFDDGTTTVDLVYSDSDSITNLASNINDDLTLQGMGISASVVQEGAQYRLKIETTGDAFTMSEQGATGAVLTDLGINNSRLLIERNTNTIDDLFAGITLSLFQKETGSNIKIDIEQDLSAAKSQITAFVDAYNALKSFINSQTQMDEATGEFPEEAVLQSSVALDNIERQIAQGLGFGVAGVSEEYSVLAQIGITFVNNSALSDPLLRDTLEIDSSKLDTALLNNAKDVRRLFSFDFSSTDPRLTPLSFSGQTAYNPDGYTINIAYTELYQGNEVSASESISLTQADTNGPTEDGFSAISLTGSIPTGSALRYSYDSLTETLTLIDLTSGTAESVNITASLDDLVGAGDLGPGETLDVTFATLGTITLSGDNGFLRGTDISDGTLDVSSLHVNTTLTGASVTTPSSGIEKATVDALIAAGAYDQASGLLTLGVTSNVSGEAHFDTAAGILFQVDAGPIVSDITGIDLDDGGPHTVNIFVNDGATNVQVGNLAFTSLASTSPGSGNLTIDVGTGLFAATNNSVNTSSSMGSYLAISDGSFEIRDDTATLLGTVNYTTGESITDLKDTINAIAGVTATIINTGAAFQLQITSDTSTPLAFSNDTGSILTELNIINRGTTIASANVGGSADGADDGSITVANNILTFTDQSGAEGLKLLFTGNTDVSGMQINFTTGIGSQLYFTVDSIMDETTGSVENEIETLDTQNEFTQERIDALLLRLERERESLMERFIAMETALTQMNAILDSIRETFKVLTNENN